LHNAQGIEVLACCDSELVGKTLKDGEITFEVREKFYREFEVSEERLAELLKEASNANLVGKKAVGVALKQGLITESSIKLIENTPHVQIFRI